ncbi:hypothetical protein HJG60_008247 [Phyllostomus discolor]|uniref:Uncharacterized protein n=1 Tax=Phyllostomus discolor TaxID=89673 RepID=A0A833Z423_9CHIR|nr:hypothetical protein HJG60_008247 [Phyllostomus discolor]
MMIFYVFKIFYLFLFLEGKGRRKRGRETSVCVCLSCTPPTGGLVCNPGMCPDWQLNRQPFGSQASTQSTETPAKAGDDILGKIVKAKSIKERIDKLDFIKIKNICFVKDHVNRVGVKYLQKTYSIKGYYPKYA